jgi:hypothetical protein
MKKLYTHENRMIIFNLKNVLQEMGIKCTVINEFASGGAGDLATFDTWPELWVSDTHRFGEAESVLQKIVFDRNDDYWYCSGCQEKNGGAFELCWKCGRSSE